MWVAKQAGVWVSAGVRTWSDGKGPTNAEWQLIMPDCYISIYPPAPSLPLRARCCHQTFLHKHYDTTARPPRRSFTFCSKWCTGAKKSNQTEVMGCLELSQQITTSFDVCAYLVCQHNSICTHRLNCKTKNFKALVLPEATFQMRYRWNKHRQK